MKKIIIIIFAFISSFSFSQEDATKKIDNLKKELADNACKCIDSVKDEIINRKRKENIDGINNCTKEYVGAFILGKKLLAIDPTKSSDINVNLDENSAEYVQAKRDLEDYLMNNCPSIKFVLASNDKENENSYSQNKKAREYYTKGVNESNNKNYEKALKYYLLSVKEDENFPFAWDNLGFCYRQLGKYDEAIEAYKKSISLDPNHAFPIQNLAIAYSYKKEYQKAIDTFELLRKLDENNPETYYGIGQIYYQYLKEYEKSLDYVCKAFNLYIKANSPYRSDAEHIIKLNYAELKKQGKEDKFFEILKANNINADK